MNEMTFESNLPIHTLFTLAMQHEPPVVNGHQLSVEEQKRC
jgi:hypothetical protein